MGGEWREVKADEFCSSVRDGTHDSPKPVDFGRFLVTSRHIIGGRLDLAKAYLISQHDFDAINKRSKVDRWDVLISMIGTVGEPCLVKEEPDFAIKNIGLFKTKSEIEGKWLYYYLRSPGTQQLIRETSRGTTQQYIPLGALRDLPVPVPADKSEMRAVAHILGTIDDKIELNRRRNQTLEAMARALFKDWFVDFGPVRAKIEGREPYLPADLWQLFPDRLDDEGKPEGWEMQSLSTLLTVIGGGTPKTSIEEYWGGDIPWFSVVDTPPASNVFVVATERNITAQGLAGSSARLIPKGTTIISARGTVGNLAIAGCDMTFNQSCYGLRGTGSAGDYFVYLTAQQMVDQLKSMAHGSVFSTITRQTFEAIQRPVPSPTVLAAFEGLVTGWFDSILSSVEESRTLGQLRDTLLPKLISGELRITDAEKLLERLV